VTEETLHHRGTTLVRRLTLAPGEATRWHTDPFHRVSVVLTGEALTIGYRDGGTTKSIPAAAGQVDWDEPGLRVHRAVNAGQGPYEEIAVFFLSKADDVPQPDAG
jgi:hypothetical protein